MELELLEWYYWIEIHQQALKFADEQGWYCGRIDDPKPIDYDALLNKVTANKHVSSLRQILFVALREGPGLTYKEIARAYHTSPSRVYVLVERLSNWEKKKVYPRTISFKNKLVAAWKIKEREHYAKNYAKRI